MDEFSYPTCENNVEGQGVEPRSPVSSLERLTQSSLPRRQRIQAATNAIAKAGKALQKINLAKLIDDMEQDQRLADRLEELNQENINEEACKDLVREAVARCQQEIKEHLDEFLERHTFDDSFPTYEEWIQDVHPENVAPGQLLPEMGMEVDGRFYVEESDHRILWNKRAPPQRQVKARGHHGQSEIDLLGEQDDQKIEALSDRNQEELGEIQQTFSEMQQTFDENQNPSQYITKQEQHVDLLDI